MSRSHYAGLLAHPEAFALMVYTDTTSGAEEVIWNSRDGVTPFILASPAGNEAQHRDWWRDRCAPLHVPAIGERAFIDLTADAARQLRTTYVERHWPRMVGHFSSPAVAVEQLVAGDLQQPGAPHLVVVDDALHAYFARRARDFASLRIAQIARPVLANSHYA